MATGYLLIQARTAHDAVPLGGVQIRIMDDRGRNVYEFRTNDSGETPKITLETVDKSLSLDPRYSGVPYITYQILAQAAGFNSVLITGVPIFDQETTIQPLSLIPMREVQRLPVRTEISVGKPAVAMREQRRQEGPVAEPRILRQVVIPDPITVHLGRPDSAASNVQVSFPDYVKNVASSEIYPTWPEASLTANIYAIITFALNRIFTEWYRSRGYDFDITNSTAYDQYFVYGRPVFENISRIVDSIFNEYVRRQGHTAPYFTSFCNGTTATCSGLSQWGTVTLAQQGLSPLQILRAYYPQDVEIAEANAITGIVTSYPGVLLRSGSSGLDVQTIQTYLNRIRRNYPAIPTITDEDGIFGASTTDAVTSFQRIFNLAVDGIVGKATWYKISSIYAAVARLAELDSEGTALGIGTVPPSSVLRYGSKSGDVLTLQYLLNVAGEYYPFIPQISQDGIFGNRTQQAVIAFQQLMRLTPDGIVGPATWRALYEVYLGIGENIPSLPPETNFIEYTVRSGDTLWLLSRRFNTTVDAIMQASGLTSDRLDIGQVLRIPVA